MPIPVLYLDAQKKTALDNVSGTEPAREPGGWKRAERILMKMAPEPRTEGEGSPKTATGAPVTALRYRQIISCP